MAREPLTKDEMQAMGERLLKLDQQELAAVINLAAQCLRAVSGGANFTLLDCKDFAAVIAHGQPMTDTLREAYEAVYRKIETECPAAIRWSKHTGPSEPIIALKPKGGGYDA